MDCIFCKIINNELPSRIVFQDSHTIVFMDIAKDVDGHMVIAPKKHVTSLFDCNTETLHHLINTVQTVSKHCVEHCGFEGVNVLHASGEAADQSIPHFHFHLIPRRKGDGIDAWPNFEGAKREIEEIYQELRIN